MRKFYIAAGIVVVLLFISVVMIHSRLSGQTVTPSAPANTAVINRVSNSNVSGTAKLEDVSGQVAILLHIDGLPEESLNPVELHHGTCATGGNIMYVLDSPQASESETDLDVNLKQLNYQKPMFVIVYNSSQDRTPLACGDIQ